MSVVFSIFPTEPPVQTTIDIHASGSVPVLMSLPQIMNLEMNFYLRSDQVYCTCDALGMYDTPGFLYLKTCRS